MSTKLPKTTVSANFKTTAQTLITEFGSKFLFDRGT